ncbi:MAG: EscU/YscU/HrcU family type III secretion system export apparatus switch protein [Deltaproteobacteria bacterium]|nr:EscU/YscU/HrcU family type III secretion system export apparatus switch protein [Deltaproteobacteria bacterium]
MVGVETGGLNTASAAGNVALQVFVSTLALPLFAAMGVAVLVGAIQTGGLFSWKAARPDFARLSPAAGLKRVFGPRMLVEMAKGLLKVSIVLAVAVTSIGWAARELPRLAGARPGSVLAALGLVAERLGVRVALALVALGTMDWLLARRRHHRSLMMTRDEVKREYKESEGDPQHRSERQRLHRELSEQRMIDDVRKADFVVVNPDHIAVAVKYDREADAAPQVVAKGERLMAERIKQVAREAGVPIYRDIGLARALNDLPEGDEIPEVLYEAVAELLRVLWQIDHGQDPGGAPSVQEAGDAVASSRTGSLSSPSSWKRV